MIINIIYYDEEVKQTSLDTDEWNKTPENILAITYKLDNGAKYEIHGYGAYFCIDGYIGGFNTILGVSDEGKKYFPCDTFIVDDRVRMGYELPNDEWKEVEKRI